MDTVLPQSRVENDKIKWFDSILVMKFLENSTPVLLGLNTKYAGGPGRLNELGRWI